MTANRSVKDNILQKYRSARNYWHNVSIRKILLPLYWRILMSFNGGVISVELQANGVGLFANLTQVLYLLVYCNEHKYVPRMRLTGINYINPEIGPDWFEYFFKYRTSSLSKVPGTVRYTLYVSNLDDLGIGKFFLPTFTDLGTTLTEAHDIFFRYVQIKSDIRETVDKFCQKYFRDGYVLGVHYRGTDKSSEAPRVSWELCCQAIGRYLAAHPEVQIIFVASDENGFVDQIRENFPRMCVVAHEDEYRSDNGQAIHSALFKGDKYKMGKEAIINSLILSNCSVLIRTTSALSGWASVFNPKMPVVLLNKPYNHTCWFPETAILKMAQICDLFESTSAPPVFYPGL